MAGFKSKKPRTGYTSPSISAGQVDREWREGVPAKNIQAGDIIAGKGLVAKVERPYRPFVLIWAGLPETVMHKMYELEPVKAFVRKDS